MNTHSNIPRLVIDGIIIPVTPHPAHEYTLTTSEAAAGYGVDGKTIRAHKARHSDELVEGKHFITVVTNSTGATNCSARQKGLKRGNDTITHWTKRGIIRLGFFIKSERAKRFRDMAEDLCLREWDSPAPVLDLSALVSAVGKLTAEVRGLRESLSAPPAQPAPAPRLETDQHSELTRFWRESIQSTDSPSDRVSVSQLLAAYLHWCGRADIAPYYTSPNTLAKALLRTVPTLHRHRRRVLFPGGHREICYLRHRLA